MKQFNKKSHWHFYCDKILTNSGEFFVNDNTEVSGNFILNKDASFHDVVDISNTLRVGYNKDITSYLGHTAIGGHSGTSGHAVFGHMDIINGSNYALKQTAAGNTYINAKALQSIQFRIGHNTEMMRITTNGKVGIGMSNPVKLLEVDGDVSAAAFYGDGSNLTGVAAELPSQTSNAGKLLTTNGSSASWATDVSLSNLDLSSNLIVKGDISAHNFKSSRIFVGNSAENDIIKIGRDAAANNPGDYSIAIGYDTGCSFSSGNSSGLYSIAIGALAGRGGQGAKSIAIGYHSGNANGVQGSHSICIGDQSKTSATYGIVIGTNAACSIGQKAIVLNTANANFGSLNLEKSLVLNAGHMPVIPALDEACYISPIRNAQNYSVLQFNRTTNEVTEASNIDISFIVSQDLSVNAALDVGGALKGATATFTGAVEAAKDTNTKNYFGRTAIGYFGHTDWGGVSHVDNATANNYAIIQNNEGKTLINSTANNYIDFRNANNRKMTMTSAGKFGIGITNPSTLLHVDGDATINENLGIGLTNPDVSFEVIGDISCSGRIDATGGIDVGNSAIKHILFGGDNASSNNERGLYWHTNNTNYGIYRTSGAWSANAYQQLMIKWRTGIIIDAGGGESFDKSHLGIVGGVSIGTTYYSTKSDNNLLVEGKLGVGLTNPTKKLEVVGDVSCSGITANGDVSLNSNVTILNTLHITSGTSGDCKLILEADTDDNNENDNPMIIFKQDGGKEESAIHHVENELHISNSVAEGAIVFNTANDNAGYTNAIERMRLDKTGKIGIGTTSPQGLLHISSGNSGDCKLILESDTDNNNEGDNPMIIFEQDGGEQQSLIGKSDNLLVIQNASSAGVSADIAFSTGTGGSGYASATERMRILSGGNIGIGLTNPTIKFEVVGDISASGDISCSGAFSAGYDTDITSYFGRAAIGFVGNLGTFSHVDSNTGTTYALGQNSAGNTYINTASTKFIAFRVNNADKMRLDADGDLGIGLTNPTKKLEVVGDISASGGVTVNSDSSFNAQVDVSGVLKFGNSATQNTLPTGRGTNGQFLKTNGSGALSWAAAGGGAFTITNDAIESNTTGTNVNTTSGSPSISIGPNSGNSGQGIKSIAMGYEAGKLNQGAHSVAIGSGAGWTTQDASSVAIGAYAGHTAQGVHNVAIGALAGRQYQGDYAVAIGSGAGETQYTGCVAIGLEAGATNQRTRSVAIGQSAGRKNQGYGNGYAIAIGANAASDVGTDKEQAAYAICIGHYAAYSNQGTAAIAIGRGAGYQNQSDNSIVIDATNAWNGANVDYDAGASRCYIAPIRNATGDDYLGYDSTTKEITYSNGAPSDDRLKHNEVDITNGLSIIRQLKPQKYQKTRKMYPADYTGDISGEWRWETGVIAQDILQINDISFVVVGGHNSKQSVRDSSGKVISDTSDPSNICNLESDVSTNYGVKYNNIFTYNIAATKELDAIVTELSNNLLAANNKITTLEQENVTIKAALNTLLTAAGQNTI